MGSRAGHDIAAPEVGKFRCAQPRLQGHDEDDMVATPDPCGSIRRGQQRIHFRAIQKLHRPLYVTLARHRQDSLAMKHVRGLAHGHEPEEGSDRSKTGIAAAGGVAAQGFDMDQEVANERGVDVFDLQFRRHPSGSFTDEAQQQAEGVSITGNRVRARLHLSAKPIREELLEESRKRCCRHGRTSPSTRRDASSSSSGTASMYQ